MPERTKTDIRVTVPSAVHAKLKAQAALARKGLQEYVIELLLKAIEAPQS